MARYGAAGCCQRGFVWMLALSICPRRGQVKLRVARSSQPAGRAWYARAAVASKLATPSPCACAAPVLRCPLAQEVDCEAELILATLMESHSLPRMADTAQQPAHTGAQGAWAADSWLQAGQQAVPSNRGAPSVSGLRDGAGPSMPRSTGEQGPRVVGDAGAVCEQGGQGTGQAGPFIVVCGGGGAAGQRCAGLPGMARKRVSGRAWRSQACAVARAVALGSP